MYSRSRAAFTLWEILGVLCIIAIVTAILFPVFQRPHDNIHRASCQSDLKQLGLALIQYTQDFDEKMPMGVNPSGNGWAGQLYPYTKSTGVYKCPDDPAQGNYISYAENKRLVSQSIATFAVPAATVELYELSTLNCNPSTLENVSATGLSAPQDSTRHDSATFALYYLAADGHVKWLKPGQVSNGLNAVPPKQAESQGYVLTFAIK